VSARAGGVAGAGRVSVGGGYVEYQMLAPETGNGTAGGILVFLHEGLGSSELWRDFPAAVAARSGRAALVWSRHNYGRSQVTSRRWGPDYMHREALVVLPELLSGLEVTRPVLVGHSDGASIALIAAGAGAVDAAGLVVLAPHVMVEQRSVEGVRQAVVTFSDPARKGRLGRYHDDPDAALGAWSGAWLAPEFRSWNIEEYLAGIACPVMAVQCEDDAYGTVAQIDRLEAGLERPLARRLIFPTGGHAPHQSHPDEVTGAIAAFVASLPPG
jgi:pimeloyl-ACP methyl ester carboxylesterase